MFNIVLFGPPGSGKGTQADLIKTRYQLEHISTGDLLRAEIANGTELGMKAKKIMDVGELVPDEVVIGMLEAKMDQLGDAKGVIFDGFPRTIAQAEALDKMLGARQDDIKLVLSIDVKEEELVKRILQRGKDSGRTDDQDEETIANRIQEYKKKTDPVAGYYDTQEKLQLINGMQDIDSVCLDICMRLDGIEV